MFSMDARTTAEFSCGACGMAAARAHDVCPRCHAWCSFVCSRRSTPVPLRDVRAEPVVRISTGVDWFDDLLGGGLAEGTLTFFAGDPGAGKSRMSLVVSSGLPVLYVAAEESRRSIRARAGELGVDVSKIDVWETQDLAEVEAHLEDVGRKYCFVVLDSLSDMRVPGYYGDDVRAAIAARDAARRTGCPILATYHVTKEGEMAGRRKVEHEGDCTILVNVDRARGVRVFETWKNRHGPAPVVREAVLEAAGFEEWREPEGGEE